MKRLSSEESNPSKRRQINVDLTRATDEIMKPGILQIVFIFLDIKSVAQGLQTYRKTWKNDLHRDGLWKSLCARLWHTKVYVPDMFRDMAENGRAAQAYKRSKEDSHRRTPSLQEVCRFTWVVRKTRSPHENATYRRYSMDMTSRSYDDVNEDVSKKTRWKLKLDNGQAFILHSREGMDVASLKVYRDLDNWGFIAQSGCYFTTSFPMPLYGHNTRFDQLLRRWTGGSIVYSVPGYEL